MSTPSPGAGPVVRTALHVLSGGSLALFVFGAPLTVPAASLDGGPLPDLPSVGEENAGTPGNLDPPADSLVVLPESFNPRVGTWTFLISGSEEPSVRSVRLRMDAELTEPALVERTTPWSRLWTFIYPPADTAGHVDLEIVSGSDSSQVPVPVRPHPFNPRSRIAQGQVGILLHKGVMGYEPGVPKRPLDAVTIADPNLRHRLHELGVTDVAKQIYEDGEDPPLRRSRTGRVFETASPYLWRYYKISFNPSHSESAVVEILNSLAVVERAKILVFFDQY
jgi:hypothetical protein